MTNIRLWIFAITGFSFWFILGFPFANHHESFDWVTQIQNVDLLDTMLLTTGHFISYRPLGQFVAVVLYRVFDNSLAPIQFYNFLLTILSWFILILAIREKRLMSLVSLTAGGILFVAFMYLFHLHGIYYSHLLLFISLLILLEKADLTNLKYILIFLMALVASLFHAFALWIFIAFLCGKVIEERKKVNKVQIIVGLFMVVTAIIFYTILVPNDLDIFNSERLAGQYMAFLKLEVNSLVSIILILLILLSSANINLPKKQRLILLAAGFVVSLLFLFFGLPLLSIWVLICLIKLILTGRYAFSGLLLISSHFMLFTGTRTSHLSIIVIMICITIASLDWNRFEKGLSLFDEKFHQFVNMIPLLVGLILIILKIDIHLPVLSRIVQPILEKKERSEQMAKIIDWYMISTFKGYKMIVDECYDFSKDSESKKRIYLTPVSNHSLNEYLLTLGDIELHNQNINDRLFVCFGNSMVKSERHVYTVKGRYAGDAYVYLSGVE
jgi:hypothetical protein